MEFWKRWFYSINQVNKRPNGWLMTLTIWESASWNTDLISSLLPHCEAALILSIPLSRRLPFDYLMWHYDSKGLFSVKSSYKVAISVRDLASPSNQSTIGTFTWNKLWRSSVPGKVKICVWKACLNIIPTRLNLEKKGWQWEIFVFCVLPLRSRCFMCLVLVHLPEQCSSPPTWIWVRDLRHTLHFGIGFLRLLALFLLLSVTCSWCLFIQSGTPRMPCYGMVSSRIRPLLITLRVFNWKPLSKSNLHPNLSMCTWFPVGLLLPLDGLK